MHLLLSSFITRTCFVVSQSEQNLTYHTLYFQACAVIRVYTDGTVLLSHGGIEMGQGLHTKMIQIASRILVS